MSDLLAPTSVSQLRIVITWLTTANGGAEASTIALAAGLAERGFETHLLWLDWTSSGKRLLDNVRPGDNLSFHLFSPTDLSAYKQTLCDLTEARCFILTNHRTIDIDAAFISDGLGACIIRGAPEPDTMVRTCSPLSGNLIETSAGRLPWVEWSRSIATFVTVSDLCAAAISSCAQVPLRCLTIANGVGNDVTAQLETVRSTHLDVDPFRCAVVARTAAWKHVDGAVKAVALARSMVQCEVSLVVYGEPGSSDDYLRSLARELRVPLDLAGWVPDLPHALARCDVLLSCSDRVEGFARNVIDAARVGLPAFVADEGAAAQLVRDGVTGCHYAARDWTALARLIERGVKNRAWLHSLGDGARFKAEEYVESIMIQRYVDLIESLVVPATRPSDGPS